MLQKKNIILKRTSFFLFILQLFIFLGCASKGIPGGGPVDKIPPEIINTYPPTDSTNIKNLKIIHVSFSESMDESSIANNIFISPPISFESEWDSDTELIISLKDSLKKKQTYVVVLGANIKDLRANKLSASYQLAFSTGPVIDKGKIAGKVYGLKRDKSISVFAFELASDSIRFDKNKPDYVSQTGDKGSFLLNYLKPGRFRIFAVDDANHNMIMDADFEQIGVPFRDVLLDTLSLALADLNFYLTRIDTLPPQLTNVRSIHNRQLNLRLSEKVLPPDVNNITIKDSITSTQVHVFTTSQNIESENILEVYTAALDSGRTYVCRVDQFADSSGNIMKETTLSFTATQKTKMDTFRIISFTPEDSALNVHPQTQIYFEVNLPLNKNTFRENFVLLNQSGDTVSSDMVFRSAFEAEVYPRDKLMLDQFYTMRTDLSKIKNVWGDSLADSIYISHFKINKGDDYGEISGNTIVTGQVSSDIEITAKKIGGKRTTYKIISKANGPFKINYIPDGNYNLRAFLDKDSSFSFSPGNLFPFQYSEPFTERSDTIKVRKRWETSGIKIIIPDFAQ